ncbi:hypothetical protein EJ04DRAFT_270394 [Polyplosphaeria fusca]|uniref:Uncharacterized protein n=1 Tax=Polyplosphaeria fusca TaxID=682080 RepID=A0A9P4QYG2_9PLEO|nr:hypothetical protein EJ04DRAFT_270394 [Polyplosphaeria fusca]
MCGHSVASRCLGQTCEVRQKVVERLVSAVVGFGAVAVVDWARGIMRLSRLIGIGSGRGGQGRHWQCSDHPNPPEHPASRAEATRDNHGGGRGEATGDRRQTREARWGGTAGGMLRTEYTVIFAQVFPHAVCGFGCGCRGARDGAAWSVAQNEPVVLNIARERRFEGGRGRRLSGWAEGRAGTRAGIASLPILCSLPFSAWSARRGGVPVQSHPTWAARAAWAAARVHTARGLPAEGYRQRATSRKQSVGKSSHPRLQCSSKAV